ncbi:ABC transporter substrate-binding protein [Solibacillus daqui]|uniref:ABC transporter substrate-binding protein n=1 Tax=Solibacillus daqui TaxID=2912187 RepID=UPI00236649EB|nr:ABC transporter substrate-binding protein [Solibacillus daqui]
MNYELALFKHFETQQRTETSIELIASIWHCSTRHAKTQLHRLHDEQLIQWEPFKWRGKKPFLTITAEEIDILLYAMKTLWKKNKYEEAIQLAKDMEKLNHPTIQQWLNAQFGLQNENNNHVFRQTMYYVELCLDPLKALSRHDMHVLEQIHETLFKIDDCGIAQPNLLFHYATKDSRTWHFILKKGVQFHHLQELTAQDVVATLTASANYFTHLFKIVKIIAMGRYEFHLELKKPCALLPYFLASTRLVILPTDRSPQIGCGAFMLKEISEKGLTLQAFVNYFNERPWIDKVDIVYNEAFQSDSIRYEPYEKSIPSRKIVYKEPGACYMCLNSRYGPLVDKELRAAIWHRIKASEYILLEENENVAHGWQLDATPINLVESNKGLLFVGQLTIGYQQIREGVNHKEKAEVLQKQLANMGIASTLQCINFKKPQEDLNQRIDIFIGGIAIGKNVPLSLVQMYLAEPKPMMQFATIEEEQQITERLQTILETNIDLTSFEWIEHRLQQNYSLKFLTHRHHIYYVREDTPYKHVQFDKNGRIDYRNMYFSMDT